MLGDVRLVFQSEPIWLAHDESEYALIVTLFPERTALKDAIVEENALDAAVDMVDAIADNIFIEWAVVQLHENVNGAEQGDEKQFPLHGNVAGLPGIIGHGEGGLGGAGGFLEYGLYVC